MSGSELKSEEDFHDYVYKAFSFPPYYGRNKDAFWDCITDIIGDVTVEITGYEKLTPEMKIFVNSYIDILEEYEKGAGGEFRVSRLG